MNPSPVLRQVYSEHRAKMLAALIRVLGDFELAEEALQEACVLALRKWGDTPPSDPVAWLLTAARNSAIDRLRRARVSRDKLAQLSTQRISMRTACSAWVTSGSV
jgi:predicted RNA polymerase sigma factor